jgi:formylglycine-generating enzyme required for sulfatase activity
LRKEYTTVILIEWYFFKHGKMINKTKKISKSFYQRNIFIGFLTICLVQSIVSSFVFGMPGDVTEKAAAEEPILFEHQADPNTSQTDPNIPQEDPNTPQDDSNVPTEKIIDMGKGITMKFVLVPAGQFDMGSPSTERDRDNDEGPVHHVTISKPFYMGKYEVTQEQYYIIAKSKPSQFKQNDRPVETVSWDQADSFCKKLSKIKGETFRLPTEGEWEYACRAGYQSRFYFGDDPNYSQIEQYAWYSANSNSETHPVGQKKPNSFGLYDMHGNVWEWCSDYYAADYYHDSMSVDPIGALFSKSRVIRGGGWYRSAIYCRSANRGNLEPYYIRNHIGFRVVLEVK